MPSKGWPRFWKNARRSSVDLMAVKKSPQSGSAPQASTVSDASLRGLFGYTLKRTFNAIQADLALTLRPFDLRMITYSLLAVIVDNPGARQSQLAQVLAIERPNLVVLLDELERSEHITREREIADRRAYALTCTLAGRRLYEQARVAVLAHEAKFLQELDAGQTDAIIASLRKIERNVKGIS
jgi:DNA-binding MarR family transcriptional regulator